MDFKDLIKCHLVFRTGSSITIRDICSVVVSVSIEPDSPVMH
ncbi:10860_t:CDS:2, partial [Gigaspora margarita]